MQETIANYWASLDTVPQGVAQGTIYGIAQGIEQGIRLGKEEGRIEGCLKSLQPVIVLLMETRFPGIADVVREQVTVIKDPNILKVLVNSLIMAKTEQDAKRLFMAAIFISNSDF